jgi:hypothetical protein
MKLVIIEPNLKSDFGHPYAVMKKLISSSKEILKKYRQIDKLYFVGHASMPEGLFANQKDLYRIVTKSCFEKADSSEVLNYLKKIINLFDLGREDLVLFTTAHLQEVLAIKELVNDENSPYFIIQIHQLYPPMEDSDMIKDPEVQRQIKDKFELAFKGLDQSRVSINTTEVEAFRACMEELSSYSVGTLPLVIETNFLKKELSDIDSDLLRLSFLGDGRKEKGLYSVVFSAENLLNAYENVELLLNVQNVRYYREKEKEDLLNKIKELKRRYPDRFRVVNGAIETNDLYDIISTSEAIVLPYDPINYRIRLSSIAYECGLLGIPVITTRGSSIGELVMNSKLSGIAYKSKVNTEGVDDGFLKAFGRYYEGRKSLRKGASEKKGYFKQNNSLFNFLEKTFNIYKDSINE